MLELHKGVITMNGFNPCLTIDEHNRNQLHLAALTGNQKLLKNCIKLINEYTAKEKKETLSEQDDNGDTALHLAALSNNDLAATLLISHEIDINQINKNNLSAVGVALRENNLAIFDILTSANNINLSNPHDKISDILATLGDVHRFKIFTTKTNANQNLTAESEWQPIDYAVLANKPDMIRYLQANFNATTMLKKAEHGYKDLVCAYKDDIIEVTFIIAASFSLGGVVKTSIPESARFFGHRYDTKLFFISSLQSFFGLIVKTYVLPLKIAPMIKSFFEPIFEPMCKDRDSQFGSKEEIANFVLATDDRYVAIKNCTQGDAELTIVKLGSLLFSICKKNSVQNHYAEDVITPSKATNVSDEEPTSIAQDQCPARSNNQTIAHFVTDIIGTCQRNTEGDIKCRSGPQPVRTIKVCSDSYCDFYCDYLGTHNYETCYHT